MSSKEMTARIAAAYDEAAKHFGMTVAHVGKAFISYTQSHATAELYLGDRHHPSLLGGTIMARTILVAMTPTKITP